MKWLNKLSIKGRLILAFALLVILFMFQGITSLRDHGRLGDLTHTLYEHPLTVSNAALSAKTGVLRMHRSMKDLTMSQSTLQANLAIQAVIEEEKNVYGQLETVQTFILGEEGSKLVRETIEMFAGWKPIRIEVEELVLKGKREAAGAITRGKGADYVARLERQMDELTRYARDKADGFMMNAEDVENQITTKIIIFIVAVIIISVLIGYLIIASILASISELRNTMFRITDTGKLEKSNLKGDNEITEMSHYFNDLIDRLKNQFWIRDGQNQLNIQLSGELSYDDILERSINFVSRYTDGCAGALYILNEDKTVCELKSSYAVVNQEYFSPQFNLGEGIVGQVAKEKKPVLLDNIASDELMITTGTVSAPSKSIYVLPLIYEEEIYGILELAAFEEISDEKKEFIDLAAEAISVSIYTAYQSREIQRFFNEAQEANEKLQAQTEELQSQAEELKSSNMEIQEQNVELENQRQQVEESNRLKSEFLSNMSHELRTPLNSINALSRVLMIQAKDRLSDEENNYLEIVERNGKQLLTLINDILDLSKVEAGKIEISPAPLSIDAALSTVVENLEPLAAKKKISLKLDLPDNLPKLETDGNRLHQILSNIVGNAVKFTDDGEVIVSAEYENEQIRISVSDTGIGISESELPYIFEEFRQVDGSTTRSFEGTGLGLAIARKMAAVLHGKLDVSSKLGIGSTFTVTLPLKWTGSIETDEYSWMQQPIPKEGEKTVLVVDDDPLIAKQITENLNEAGYTAVGARSGSEALKLAEKIQPFAITLDIMMPEMDGWEVLQKLKANEKTADIPVIVVSISNDHQTGFALGAIGYVSKPVEPSVLISEIRKLNPAPATIMVVDDNEVDRMQIHNILEEQNLVDIQVESGKKCLEILEESLPDIMVLDLMMPEIDGFQVLDELRSKESTRDLPVIVVTSKDLTADDKSHLSGKVTSVLTKGNITPNTLVDEIKRILNQLGKYQSGENSHPAKEPGNRILIVEDNEIAVIQVKKVLEAEGFWVDTAVNGEEALAYIKHTVPDGIILDLMMPGIDGFQVLEEMRSSDKTRTTPVLVLTAKSLTKADLSRLSANNISQLVQKGDIDIKGLLEKVKNMVGNGDTVKRVPGPENKPAKPVVRKSGGKPNVLVIEDNPDNMITVRAILGNRYSIIESKDGKDGLEKAGSLSPDLVLLDISLPKMDGIEVVTQMKNDSNIRNIPVIAITAKAMKNDREEIIAAGCDEYVSKPIDSDELLAKIDRLLNN